MGHIEQLVHDTIPKDDLEEVISNTGLYYGDAARFAPNTGNHTAFVLKPPGWSPDGKGETTEDMRGARALPAGSSTSGFVRSGS